jgi:hypothetical protein
MNRGPEPGYCNKGQRSFFMVQEQWTAAWGTVTKDRDLNQGSGTRDRDSKPGYRNWTKILNMVTGREILNNRKGTMDRDPEPGCRINGQRS